MYSNGISLAADLVTAPRVVLLAASPAARLINGASAIGPSTAATVAEATNDFCPAACAAASLIPAFSAFCTVPLYPAPPASTPLTIASAAKPINLPPHLAAAAPVKIGMTSWMPSLTTV